MSGFPATLCVWQDTDIDKDTCVFVETEAGAEDTDRQMYFSCQCPVQTVVHFKYKYNTITIQDRDKHLSVYTVEQLRG